MNLALPDFSKILLSTDHGGIKKKVELLSSSTEKEN